MIHSVGTHSLNGSCAKGVDYTLQEKDHNGTIRESVTLLRGDPSQIIALEDTMTTKHTYLHTSLSFTNKEAEMLNSNPDKLDAIIDSYIEQMAAGLPSADRLPYIAVRHGEPSKFHVEFIILRIDLETGKTYQPFVSQRGDVKRFQDWNVTMQADYELENPHNIEHARESSWSKNLPHKANEARIEINSIIKDMVNKGAIQNRDDIIKFINSTENMTVSRKIPSAISIKIDGHKQPIKFKGALYEQSFTNTEQLRKSLDEKANPDAKKARQRLTISMQKLADSSHEKYKDHRLNRGRNNTINQSDSVRITPNMDMERQPAHESRVSRELRQTDSNVRRSEVAISPAVSTRPKWKNMGATDEEVRIPTHKIFNNVQYNQEQQVWHWQGSYGFAQVQATEGGYTISNGNRMEWQMAAELLKQNGATHVQLTCSTEQSMLRAIRAHVDADLNISNIKLNGQELSTEQIKERLQDHDKTTKLTRNNIIDERVSEERQTSNDIERISDESTKINQFIEQQSDTIKQASQSVEQLINSIEDDIARQKRERESEYER